MDDQDIAKLLIQLEKLAKLWEKTNGYACEKIVVAISVIKGALGDKYIKNLLDSVI